MLKNESIVVCGREFSASDVEVIRRIIASNDPPLNRYQISLKTCEQLGWQRPNGALKDMSCRVALLRMEKLGLIQLPRPLHGSSNGKPFRPRNTLGPPLFSIPSKVRELVDLCLHRVATREDSRVWNEAVSRFHYLGYQRLPGAQIRYAVRCSSGLLGVLGFGASAWKVAPRDEWIGWSHEQRKGKLDLIVNNARFLILPWVRVRNLASWILSKCAKRLPNDWEEQYGYRPVLLETFVDSQKFRGTCYAAANWSYVGETKGRGKLDRKHLCALPQKRIYLYPLSPNFREVLCS